MLKKYGALMLRIAIGQTLKNEIRLGLVIVTNLLQIRF